MNIAPEALLNWLSPRKGNGMATNKVKVSTTERTRIRQHAERSVPAEAEKFLIQGTVAHVGFVQDGQPFVIPFTYQYDPATPGRLFLHGSPSSRTLAELSTGQPVCVTITLLDGLVYSRTALYHSMNYRSVVCFGRARTLESREEKKAVFDAMTRRYFPGRTAGRDYQAPTPEHLDGTVMVEVLIDEMSAKTRTGPPKGPQDADPDAPGNCGVVLLESGARTCPF